MPSPVLGKQSAWAGLGFCSRLRSLCSSDTGKGCTLQIRKAGWKPWASAKMQRHTELLLFVCSCGCHLLILACCLALQAGADQKALGADGQAMEPTAPLASEAQCSIRTYSFSEHCRRRRRVRTRLRRWRKTQQAELPPHTATYEAAAMSAHEFVAQPVALLADGDNPQHHAAWFMHQVQNKTRCCQRPSAVPSGRSCIVLCREPELL